MKRERRLRKEQQDVVDRYLADALAQSDHMAALGYRRPERKFTARMRVKAR